MAGNFDFLDLEKELEKFGNEVIKNTEEALTKAGEYVIGRLQNAMPIATGRTKESWVLEEKYKRVRYINNTALNSNKIPIVNLLEYSRKGKPFVRRTFDSCVPQIESIIKNNVLKGE